jgi:hypothetical protein
VINEVVRLLKPLKAASKRLENAKFTTVSTMLATVYSYLHTFPRDSSVFTSKSVEFLKNYLIDKLVKAFKFMLDSPQADFYLTCMFLDPKHKSFAFMQNQDFIDYHHAKVWAYLKANFDQPEKLSELEQEFNEYKNLELETKEFYGKYEATFPLLSSLAKDMLCVVAGSIQASYYWGFEKFSVYKGSEEFEHNEELLEAVTFLKENIELTKRELKDFVYDSETVEKAESEVVSDADTNYDTSRDED